MNSQLRNMIRRLNLLSSASIKEEERYHCHSDDVEFHCKMLSDADVADVVHVWAIQRPRDSNIPIFRSGRFRREGSISVKDIREERDKLDQQSKEEKKRKKSKSKASKSKKTAPKRKVEEEFKAAITEDNMEEQMRVIRERCMVEQGDCASDLCEELNVKPPVKKRKAGNSVAAGKKEKANAMMQEVEHGWKCPKGLNWINKNGNWYLKKGFNGKSISLGSYPNTMEGLRKAAFVAGRFDAVYTKEFKAAITEDNVEEKRREIKERFKLNVKPRAKKRKARTIDNAEAKKIASAMMQKVKPDWKFPSGLTWRKDTQCWFFKKSVKGKTIALGCYPNTIEGLQMAVLVAGRFVAICTKEFKATINEDNVEDKRKEIQRRCMVKQGQDCASDLCEELNVKPPAKKKVKVAQHEEDGDE